MEARSYFRFITLMFFSSLLFISIGCKKDDGDGDDVLKDIDGNTYRSVTINDQVWMQENLRTTKFNDGSSIDLVTGKTEWTNLKEPGYCWYNNDESVHKQPFGALYNYYSVATGKLCPTGWRIPSTDDFKRLELYLDMDPIEADNLGWRGTGLNIGGQLKSTEEAYWIPPNNGATNETGFSARGSGGRSLLGEFIYLKQYGYLWTSTVVDNEFAVMRGFGSAQRTIFKSHYQKEYGFPVRCIKN